MVYHRNRYSSVCQCKLSLFHFTAIHWAEMSVAAAIWALSRWRNHYSPHCTNNGVKTKKDAENVRIQLDKLCSIGVDCICSPFIIWEIWSEFMCFCLHDFAEKVASYDNVHYTTQWSHAIFFFRERKKKERERGRDRDREKKRNCQTKRHRLMKIGKSFSTCIRRAQ